MMRWAAAVVGLPGTLAMAGAAAWLAAAWLGAPVADAGADITLSEAAMLADHADVVRLTSGGADPNAVASVRAGTIDLRPHTMSPLEAATRSHQSGIMQLLIDSGARITGVTYPALWCSATRIPNNRDVTAFLDAHRPPGFRDEGACQP